MMKRLILIPAALLLAVLVALAFRSRGWTADGFIISNADATSTLAMAPDQNLIGLINQISPRFVIEYANANRFYSMVPAPPDLLTLLGQISPRFVIEYANANRFYSMVPAPQELLTLLGQVSLRFVIEYANANKFFYLTPVPSELITLIGQVAPRFVFQYANANKFYTLAYPGALVGDTQAPAVSNVTVTVIAPGSVKITWVTDEYATSLVELGSTSGIYTQTATDNEYKKDHAAIFTGLVEGMTYYYLIHNTDRSGNPGVTSELSFEYKEAWRVFLPFAKK
jgi:hypothetical protein